MPAADRRGRARPITVSNVDIERAVGRVRRVRARRARAGAGQLLPELGRRGRRGPVPGRPQLRWSSSRPTRTSSSPTAGRRATSASTGSRWSGSPARCSSAGGATFVPDIVVAGWRRAAATRSRSGALVDRPDLGRRRSGAARPPGPAAGRADRPRRGPAAAPRRAGARPAGGPAARTLWRLICRRIPCFE